VSGDLMSQPRLEFLDPAQLDDHPANWKFHPPDQLDTLRELIDELGWLKPLVFNERTRRLLDGHGRKALFSGRSQGVPVYVVDLDPALETKALATLDPVGWTSVVDKAKYDSLLKSNDLLASTRDGVHRLLGSVSRAGQLLDAVADPDRQASEADEVTIPLDSIWPSDNAYGVPSLDLAMQAESVPYPVWTWGSIGHSRPMPGTWHFYTDDRKFEPLWRRPQRVLASGPAAIVEPNFSTTDQQPLACALWHVYRKRWLARYWQARGLRVFCDLNVDSSLNHPCDGLHGAPPNLLGVPRGWRSYASRAHADSPGSLDLEWEVAQEWAAPQRPTFLVVGGGRKVKALAQERGWVWVPEQMQIVHQKAEAVA
jgi:hypothetical protein